MELKAIIFNFDGTLVVAWASTINNINVAKIKI